MRLINTKAHSLFDYLMGSVLVLYPRYFSNDQYSPVAAKISMLVGILLVLTALSSQFEWSILRILDLKVHYFIDIALGLLLATSPWIFQFPLEFHKPHLVFGLAIIVFSILSDRVLSREVNLIMNRKVKKPAPPLKPRKFSFPGLKLIVDPFYAFSVKAWKKTDSFFKSREI